MASNGQDIAINDKATAVSKAIHNKVDSILEHLQSDPDCLNAIVCGLLLQAAGRAKLAGWTDEMFNENAVAMFAVLDIEVKEKKPLTPQSKIIRPV